MKQNEIIEKAEQDKPVALVTGVYGGRFTYAPIKASVILPVGMALYTTPHHRKPLTDEQIDDLARTMVKGNKSVNWLARAIEAAHGINYQERKAD